MTKNSFDRKTVEKELLTVYMPAASNKRRTRTYLRKQARNIERGFEIGFRDGQNGKPLVPLNVILNPNDSPLTLGISRLAYEAYQRGYQLGKEVT